MLVPAGVRCCRSHLEDDALKHGVKLDTDHLHQATVPPEELVKVLMDMRNVIGKDINKKLDFDSPLMSNNDYVTFTGITRSQFDEVFSVLDLRSSPLRTARQALGILLTKLRTGLSHRLLASLFNIKTKQKIGRIVSAARESLMKCFVPNHLGFGHLTRQEIIDEHTTDLAKALFISPDDPEDCILIVLDGTYLEIQKSRDHTFQRKAFCGHKHYPLIKPMMIVTTTGYIISVLGPYLSDGHNSDSSILEHLLATDTENIREFLKEEDKFVLDRGFRGCLEFLSTMNFTAYMPSTNQPNKQHTTDEANESRLVTKIRWVVECANGRVKTWEFLNHVISNSQVQFAGDYIRIIAALCNAFRPPLAKSHPQDESVAQKMLAQLGKENELQQRVSSGTLSSRGHRWEDIDAAELPDFPKLDEDYLRALTFGVYQVRQAKQYIAEHLEMGDFFIQIHQENPGLIKCKIQSRHVAAKVYHVWVEYIPELDGQDPPEDPVTGWYCQCRAGARTVGCCSHITSILLYLGVTRHDAEYKPPATLGTSIIDARDLPQSDDDDTDDSDESDEEDEVFFRV